MAIEGGQKHDSGNCSDFRGVRRITANHRPRITGRIVEALDPDFQLEAAKKTSGAGEPSQDQIKQAATKLIMEAAQPIAANPNLRNRLVEAHLIFRFSHLW